MGLPMVTVVTMIHLVMGFMALIHLIARLVVLVHIVDGLVFGAVARIVTRMVARLVTRSGSLRTNRDDLHHAGVHMIQEMAMEGPVTDLVRRDIERQSFSRFHNNRMLSGFTVSSTVYDVKKHTMQMYGMRHHGVVN